MLRKLSASMLLLLLITSTAFSGDLVIGGFTIPGKIGGFSRNEVNDLESEKPGLGTLISFTKPGSKITLYIYDKGLEAIPDGTGNEFTKDEFVLAVAEIKGMAELGFYHLTSEIIPEAADLKLSNGETLPVLYSQFSYIDKLRNKTEELSSMIFITANNNQFIKVRASTLLSETEGAADAPFEFMTDLGKYISE